MEDRDLENLFTSLNEVVEELDILFHDYDIEFLGCEDDDCNEDLPDDIIRLLGLLKEVKLIIEDNS